MPDLEIAEISGARFQEMAAGRGSWRQYPAYAAQAARRVGSRVRFLAIQARAEPIALAAVRYRTLPLGIGATALVSHGPVLVRPDGLARGDLREALAALARYGASQGWELRIDPDPLWWLGGHQPDPALFGPAVADEAAAAAAGGYRTIVVDIAPPLEDIRGRLNGKWRRSLQSAEKAGLECVVSADPAAIARAQGLLADLMQRKAFAVPQDAEFFARVAADAKGDEAILAHSIFHQGRLVSIHIGAFAGEMPVYLLGATVPEGRSLGASYLAQWRVIETAKARGKAFYDLGGIDPAENPDVYRFKKRMGGDELALGRIFTLSCQGPRATAAMAVRRLATGLRR